MTHKDEPVTAGEKGPPRSFMEKAIFRTGELRLRPIDIAFEKFIGSRKRIDDMDTFSAGWNAICFELEAEHTAALTALRERLEKEVREARAKAFEEAAFNVAEILAESNYSLGFEHVCEVVRETSQHLMIRARQSSAAGEREK